MLPPVEEILCRAVPAVSIDNCVDPWRLYPFYPQLCRTAGAMVLVGADGIRSGVGDLVTGARRFARRSPGCGL